MPQVSELPACMLSGKATIPIPESYMRKPKYRCCHFDVNPLNRCQKPVQLNPQTRIALPVNLVVVLVGTLFRSLKLMGQERNHTMFSKTKDLK